MFSAALGGRPRPLHQAADTVVTRADRGTHVRLLPQEVQMASAAVKLFQRFQLLATASIRTMPLTACLHPLPSLQRTSGVLPSTSLHGTHAECRRREPLYPQIRPSCSSRLPSTYLGCIKALQGVHQLCAVGGDLLHLRHRLGEARCTHRINSPAEGLVITMTPHCTSQLASQDAA